MTLIQEILWVAHQMPEPEITQQKAFFGPGDLFLKTVKTWHCQTCGREMGQYYALHGWDYYGKIICPDCLHASRQEVI